MLISLLKGVAAFIAFVITIAVVVLALMLGSVGAAPAEGCRQWTWSIPVDALGADVPEYHGCKEAPWGTKRQSWINDEGRCAWHARKAVRLGADSYADVATAVERRGCVFISGEGWRDAPFVAA